MTGAGVQKDLLILLSNSVESIEKIKYLGFINRRVNVEHFCKGNMGDTTTFLRKS